jgi:hypothetical protein
MLRHKSKIRIGREHRQIMPDAKLRQQGIDRTDLDTASPASVSQCGRVDVIAAVRGQERQSGEPRNDLFARSWAGKALQQFLKYQAGRQNRLTSADRLAQCGYFRERRRHVTSESQRPNAGIDEQAQSRLRSAL